jgi:hypothetical protein
MTWTDGMDMSCTAAFDSLAKTVSCSVNTAPCADITSNWLGDFAIECISLNQCMLQPVHVHSSKSTSIVVTAR